MPKKKKPKANPVGAPTEYEPIYCAMLIKHMEDGLSFEAFAGIPGVSFQTLYNWEKRYPEFLEAKAIGMGKCRLWWEIAGNKGCFNETIKDGDGMTVTRSINASVYIFNMKNRFGWRDKQPDEVDAQNKAVSGLKVEQLLKWIMALESVKT